ncbi:multiple epidermal growth factor-like domains protein 9 [Mercenaria mercenaria]|uniref:multiple epidermal growth factor-like domains protein 9 n=1 Tax=Mercenaria mercenaria TaxID=6596 RepID=UPI00234E3981|nr:multiple epidermal growth factor-like domains protein 9 [Mercenaria mercenaria]XP_053398729.1 multiple epidermal growth factor-like domains protein 9 [Mercenaria mercenaria]XP_053398730.1 multiple epidermal growth factor-like domains protein 9 [Mercenaria mercenaria]
MMEVNITDLPSSVEHKIIVSAVYLTNSTISAEAVTDKTAADPSKASNCYCDPFGTKDGYKSCNLSLTHVPWCECKPRHAGLFCEICAHGYNRTARSLPCHTCPCPETFSTGSCHFMEGYLHCTTCREVYTGNLCHRCANGYYRDHAAAPSKCIKCQGCHDITPGLICDPFNAEKNTSTKPPAAGIIVVGTIVLLSGIVGFIVYKRSHNFPKNKPF